MFHLCSAACYDEFGFRKCKENPPQEQPKSEPPEVGNNVVTEREYSLIGKIIDLYDEREEAIELLRKKQEELSVLKGKVDNIETLAREHIRKIHEANKNLMSLRVQLVNSFSMTKPVEFEDSGLEISRSA